MHRAGVLARNYYCYAHQNLPAPLDGLTTGGHTCPMQTVLSSAFESSLGLAHIASLASQIRHLQPPGRRVYHGLGTGDWFVADICAVQLVHANGRGSYPGAWASLAEASLSQKLTVTGSSTVRLGGEPKSGVDSMSGRCDAVCAVIGNDVLKVLLSSGGQLLLSV